MTDVQGVPENLKPFMFGRYLSTSSGLWSRDVDVEHVTKRLGQELHWSPKFHWWQKQYHIHLWRGNQRCYSLLGLAYQPPARQDYQSTSIPQAHTYLHFQSHHPIHHKSGVVRTLMDRKDTLVSTEDDKDREELHIRNALKSCGYDEWGNTWDTLGDGTGDRRTNKRTDRQTNRWTSPLRNASLRRGLNQTVLHSH